MWCCDAERESLPDVRSRSIQGETHRTRQGWAHGSTQSRIPKEAIRDPAATQAAKRAWRPASQPAWLNENSYRKEIQPRLAAITISRLASTLGVSEPYAAYVRAGRHQPHPRHWEALAKLVGVSQ